MSSTISLLRPLLVLGAFQDFLLAEGISLRPLALLVWKLGVREHHPDRVFTQTVTDLALENVVVGQWMEGLIKRQMDAPSTRGALRGAVPFAEGNAYLERVRDAVFQTVRILAAERTEALGPVGTPTLTVSFGARKVRLTAADRLSPRVRELHVEDPRVDPRSERALDWLDSLGSVQLTDRHTEGDLVTGHDEESLVPMSLFTSALREAKEFGFTDAYDPSDPGDIMELAEHLERSYNRALAYQLRAALQVHGTTLQARTYFLPDSDQFAAEEVAWHQPAVPGEYVGTTHLPWRSTNH